MQSKISFGFQASRPPVGLQFGLAVSGKSNELGEVEKICWRPTRVCHESNLHESPHAVGKCDEREADVLTLTRKADYALVAMADLARQDSAVVTTSHMASRLRMPLPVLQVIMTELARQGLVTSARGPRGGFRLSRPPTRITVAQIIEAIEGPFRLAMCCRPELGGQEVECDLEDVCQIRDTVRKVHRLIQGCLSGVTLTELVDDHVQVPLGFPETWRGLGGD